MMLKALGKIYCRFCSQHIDFKIVNNKIESCCSNKELITNHGRETCINCGKTDREVFPTTIFIMTCRRYDLNLYII